MSSLSTGLRLGTVRRRTTPSSKLLEAQDTNVRNPTYLRTHTFAARTGDDPQNYVYLHRGGYAAFIWSAFLLTGLYERKDRWSSMEKGLLRQVAVPVASPEDARSTAIALRPYVAEISALTVIHVVEKAGGAPDKVSVEQREDYATDCFDAFEATMADIDIERTILYGNNVAEAIERGAAEMDATVIIMTPREGTRWTRLLSGNVAETLRTIATRPILILPRPETTTNESSSFIRRLFGTTTEQEVIAECRRCGTTVEPDADICPECGAAEIHQYEIK